MFEETITSARFGGISGKISYVILGVFMFLLPFFFIPSAIIPLQLSKGILFTLATVLTTIVFIISVIKEGKLIVPKNLFFLSLFLLPLVAFLSALVGGKGTLSFLGYAFEVGSVAFMFLGALLLFLVSRIFQSKEEIFYAYLGFFASFAVVLLFQLLRILFGPDFLSFGLFTGSLSNFIGNWNDLGIFFAVSAILSLVTLEMLQLSRLFKALLYIVFAFSIFFLTLVNFVTLWIVLGAFALVFFIYVVSFDKFSPSQEFVRMPVADGMTTSPVSVPTLRRKVSYNALILILVSFLFLVAGSTLGQKMSDTFNVVSVEVRPSWASTFSVVGQSIRENPVFGSGPNTFNQVWNTYKPDGINETIFWGTDFAYGIGFIPTLFATTGILGVLAWAFFFVMFVWMGLRAIFFSLSDLFSRYLVTSSFLVSLFLWIMSFLYVPSITILTLTFFFTGLFAASLEREGILASKPLSLTNHPKLSFVSVLLLLILLIANATLGYLIFEKTASVAYFQKSLKVFREENDLDRAEEHMVRAINLGGYDTYYRGLSQFELIRVDSILAEPGATPESVRERFQQALGNAIENAREATEINPTNYQNWVALAQVYAALVPQPFAIPGAYENAKRTFEEAGKVNPSNPTIPLLLGRLEASKGDYEAARTYANQALALKQNYAEAHFLIAQIEVVQGNMSRAIPSLETAVLLSPNDPGLFFQLGLLKYNQRDNAGAIQAFAGALQIVPEYANAKYFLGLALHNVGRSADAVAVFEDLLKSNPDNVELTTILENLKAGKEPFANVPPPDNRPETRDALPLSQES